VPAMRQAMTPEFASGDRTVGTKSSGPPEKGVCARNVRLARSAACLHVEYGAARYALQARISDGNAARVGM